ncbi:carbon-nitrogen family hydrolase [Peterkaempfera griseoplana]|uniref:carbon-nitrogen family hydrolase n=1 Tax=Peterkaempfera griseoplana TaxID=66896 RepID=UPI0006E3EEAD|nr:carbon-nitrogen family hydrolase [Peterkaempfera griseoplana]BCN13444.1 carbon-nitrogen family hydrolase [Peterkaempfera griseoplana]
MRIDLLQIGTDPALPLRERVETVCEQIAACRGADLVVLPELWPTGYFHFDDYPGTAEPLDGRLRGALAEAARSAGAHLHAGSFVERDGSGRLYNTSLLFTPDGELASSYRKMHLFGHDSRESALLTAGEAVVVSPAPFGAVGLATCYDLRFPELFRSMVEQGAELIVLTAAWPLARIDHWRLLVRARAVENQALVVAANAAGVQAGVAVGGHSMVVDPRGQVLAAAGSVPQTLSVDFDPAETAAARKAFPVLSDRRLAAVTAVSAVTTHGTEGA